MRKEESRHQGAPSGPAVARDGAAIATTLFGPRGDHREDSSIDIRPVEEQTRSMEEDHLELRAQKESNRTCGGTRDKLVWFTQ